MERKLLLPIAGLAVIVIAVIALWLAGLDRDPAPVPPIPANLDNTEAAVVDLIHQKRSVVMERPSDALAWLDLGMVYEANTNNALARECYERSVTLDPTCARCWYHTAQTRFATSEYEAAIEAMRRATDLQGDYTPAHWRLGFWLLDQGDLEAAEAAFARATRQSPRDPAGWFGLAMVRMRQQRDEEAARILEDVLEWTPFNRFYGNQLLGTVYRRLGRVEEAERLLMASEGGEIVWPDTWSREISKYHRGAGWKIEMPMQYLMRGQADQAEQLLRSFLRDDPENSILLSQLAIVYRSKGQLDDSIEALKKAIEIHEHYHQAHFNLGLAYLMMAERATDPRQVAHFERLAREHADFALNVNPSYASGHGLKGQLLERSGDDEQAVEEYRIAAKDPASGQHWLDLLATLLMKLNRWAEAAEVLLELQYRYPPQPQHVYDLALAQLNAGQFEQAVQTAERFARQWPNDGRAAELRRRIQSQGSGPTRPGTEGS